MTRKEIVNSYIYKITRKAVDYSQKYAKDDKLQGIVMDTFEDAADFGYNLAIDKACEWLKNDFEELTRLHLDDIAIDKFRKAMKGE